ncbi:HEAT repeat-containing protein 2 [Papilio machaon]|uniref:HEAT repeat-containing protein 2 n=1 Tax=Papilio machaon TaxID=76193 RepID=A0A194QSM0_PAPMA|nr:HEAT repeat-containing protein 2 [Papilio machaon]
MPELKSNPKGVLEPYITTLQSESKLARKQAFQKINYEIFENPVNEGCDFTVIFPEIYAYVLKGFSDASEGCREMSILIISNFIEHLPLNDYYLTYILPVIVRRIGCAEIVEDSEEVRLLLIELVHKILIKYKNTQLLTSFFNDFTSILTKTSTDPFPKVKLEACECIILLSKIINREFHLQCESFIKPVLSNFAHQHFRVRVAAIRAIGAIVISGNAKCFELSITPMAEKLFDENTQVRLQVTLEVGNWMMKYKDRYSFWHRMIPLMLTSLSDVMADIRTTATKLWSDIGLQYMEENEEDLKKKLDFLKDVPTHYPDVKRPNFGCRCLIKRAAELFGYFITPETWWPLLEADVDSWPALTVIANILKGSKPDLVKGKVMKELCKELSDPDRCRVRKPKYQTNLVHVTEALMSLCGQDCAPVYEDLFIINFTVYAMPYDDKMQFMALSNLDKLRQLEDCGRTLTTLYDRHIRRILVDITSDALTWTLLTPDRCLLECVMLNAGYAMGSQLHLLAPLLRESLATPQVDPEVKLKVFTALSTVLLRRQTNFSKCDTDKLESFLNIVIEEIIVPNLVWAPGRTAEAIRTAAAACLCSALQDDPHTDLEDKGADGDANDKKVNLFPSKESLEPLLERVVPLVCGAADDNSALTRQHALRALACLATLATARGCFTPQLLHNMYFVVLKRLDDSSDKVRSFAVRTVRTLFSQRPRPYDTVVFGAHVDALYSAMLIHLDDPDEEFRKEMLAALIALSDVDPQLLIKKVKANIHLYRNKAAYESLSSHIENMLK